MGRLLVSVPSLFHKKIPAISRILCWSTDLLPRLTIYFYRNLCVCLFVLTSAPCGLNNKYLTKPKNVFFHLKYTKKIVTKQGKIHSFSTKCRGLSQAMKQPHNPKATSRIRSGFLPPSQPQREPPW